MKRLILPILFILAICSSAFAQSFRAEFDKARSIKLLESNRDDVKRIFKGFESDEDGKNEKDYEPIYEEIFSGKYTDIEVSYSTGDCSDKSKNTGKWNISKGKVELIEISLDDPIKLKDFKFDISSFQKEKKYSNNDDEFVYHNKDLGISFDVDDGELENIILFPSNSYYSLLCENEESNLIREFYSTESFYGNSKLKDRIHRIPGDKPPIIDDLILSADGINFECEKTKEEKNCSSGNGKISVTIIANNPEEDVLTYNYTVSGGEIIGKGKEVIWDLSIVQPGTYTITATVDDGCGVCAEPKTKVVVVK